MCTRYYIDTESEFLLPYVQAAGKSSIARTFLEIGTPLIRSGEVRPCDVAPVLATSRRRTRAVFPMKWGYTLTGASGERVSLLLNARSETAGTKPTFAEGWREHRCIIPASWYFEWEHLISPSGKKKTGAKYMIQPKGSQLTFLCGLYRKDPGKAGITCVERILCSEKSCYEVLSDQSSASSPVSASSSALVSPLPLSS